MKRTSGVSLMLLIFLSLCLITFSLLSLSSAQADKNLCEKSVLRTSEYYAAEVEAYQLLSRIDQLLTEAYLVSMQNPADSDDPEADYFKIASSSVSALPSESDFIQTNDFQYIEETHSIEYRIPVNEKQILQIFLELCYPQNDTDTFYKIHTWQVVNTYSWTPDTSLNVYQRTGDNS